MLLKAGLGYWPLIIASLFCLPWAQAQSPPANDPCAAAADVGPLPASVAGATTHATLTQGVPSYCDGTDSSEAADVWYTVVGTGNRITVSTCDGPVPYDTQIAVFCNDCDNFTCVGGSDDACPPHLSEFSWCSHVGVTYLIRVYGWDGDTGEFTLEVSDDGVVCCASSDPCAPAPSPPFNDLWAVVLQGDPLPIPTTVIGYTCDASLTEEQPECADPNYWGGDVWYKVVGTDNALTVSTCGGASYDTQLAVYTVDNGELVCVGGADGALCPEAAYISLVPSRFAWCSTDEEIYLIRVYGWGGERGEFTLEITEGGSVPENDLRENATAIGSLPASFQGSTTCAHPTEGAPSCPGNYWNEPDVWYSVVGTGNAITASTCGTTSYDTQLAVYTVDVNNDLVCVGGADGAFCPDAGFWSWGRSQLSWCGTPDETYLIRVFGYWGDRGAFTLAISEDGGAPGNDEPEHATLVDALPATIQGSTSCATLTPNVPRCSGNSASEAPDVWYTVAGTGKKLTASTCDGSSYDTQIAIFTVDNNALSCVGGDNNGCGVLEPGDPGHASLGWCSVADETYLIRVYGHDEAKGAFTLHISEGACGFGACCFSGSNACQLLNEAACRDAAGTFQGKDSTCTFDKCQLPTINPPPIYNEWDETYEVWYGGSCDGGLKAPQGWPPYYYYPLCDAWGDPDACCYCWKVFPTWYYQSRVPFGGSPCDTPGIVHLEQAPLYLPGFPAAYACNPSAPTAPTYWAYFQALEGLDCLKNIPLECTMSARPVVAAARYKISLQGAPSSSENAYSGALFWVTAAYDETIFDVRLHGWKWSRGGDWNYSNDEQLGSLQPRLFQDHIYDNLGSATYRQSEWRGIPACVEVRLRDGRTLEDVHGRTVRLLLHTLNWAGGSEGCPEPEHGDRLSFAKTDDLEVGVCPEVSMEDWYIEPPPLRDECSTPNLPESVQSAAAFEGLGVRVVNDINVDLPALRVGHNRWKAARTLAETLGNDAYWYQEAAHGHDVCMCVNVLGTWFAVEDVPGWRWGLNSERGEVYVSDDCSGWTYWYGSTLALYPRGKLRSVDEGNNPQREYAYENGDIRLNLIAQYEPTNPSIRISYAYAAVDDEVQLTVTGQAPPDADRSMQTTFGPPPVTGAPDWTRPLVEATVTSGGAAGRQYEWYPVSNPPTPFDRKLKKVSDPAGHVLAEFTYDGQGRLIKRSRGSVGMGDLQTVAEFIYNAPGEPEYPKMTARFCMDAANYQCAVRRFSGREEVVSLAEYEELGTGGELPSGNPATTTFNYYTPDEDDTPEQDSFHFQWCTIGNQQVVLSRCLKKTWPSGLVSQYTFFDCDFHPVESYLHLSVPDLTADPPEAEKIQHSARTWTWQDVGVWQVTQERNVYWDESVTREAPTDLTYYDGFLIRREEPTITEGVNTGFRAWRTWQYDNQHRVDYEERNDGAGETVRIDYAYDKYGYMKSRTENPGAGQIQRKYVYNGFGDLVQQTDPDGYVTIQQRNAAGLLENVYTYASGASGPVIRQMKYTYEVGRVKTAQVAVDDGPFALDAPTSWVTTTYDYDNYGRLTTKTVTPGNYVTSYEYDVQDRIKRITFPDGIWKEWVRNGRGYVVETHIGVGEDPVLVSTYHYDLNGNLDQRTCEGCPDCPALATYVYDEFNRRTEEFRVK